MSVSGLEKFKEVPIDAKIWLSSYDCPGFLKSADLEKNRFVLSIPPHWILQEFFYDEKSDKLIKVLPPPEPIKITIEKEKAEKAEISTNEIVYPERT